MNTSVYFHYFVIILTCFMITIQPMFGAEFTDAVCDPDSELDVVFLIDVTGDDCTAVKTFAAETMAAIKQEETSPHAYAEVRFAGAIQGGLGDSYIFMHLNAGINDAETTAAEITQLYDFIDGVACDTDGGNDLNVVVDWAGRELTQYHTVTGRNAMKRIVIFSQTIYDFPDSLASIYAPILNQSDVDVTMVNIELELNVNAAGYDASNYLLDLTDNKAERVIVVNDITDSTEKIRAIADIQEAIGCGKCSAEGLRFGDGANAHMCQCRDDCKTDASYCNSIEWVAFSLNEVVDSDLCESGECCCSCINCGADYAPPPDFQ